MEDVQFLVGVIALQTKKNVIERAPLQFLSDWLILNQG